ncbi:MAG: pantetheine-phosphate adenylyltransferase [Candidatus Aminicenantes bacterium]|jgi:pantetheine-phosphate adenylyltransferase
MKNLNPFQKRTAVYPGSFDPITNGHVDIIERGLKIFDRLIVAVLENPKKKALFPTKKRVDMIKDIFTEQKNIEVKSFSGLLVDFMKENRAKIVIRGLRAISDFEYEFQMALMNMKLEPEIETLFMMPNVSFTFLSSRLVKEVAMLGGDLKGLIPRDVERELNLKFKEGSNTSSD